MSQEDRYFQFPLCALRFGNNISERLNAIICYGFIEAGQSLWNKLPEEKQDEWKEYFKAERTRKASWLPGEINFQTPAHYAWLYGMYTIGLNGGNFGYDGKRHQALQSHEYKCAVEGGKDAEVRINKGLVFEVRDGKGMSYPEFAVLCAIYSAIGSKKSPVRITLETIGIRAHGCKSKATFKEATHRTDGFKITAKQLRNTVAKLHQLGWFARVTFGQRQTYYSHRMTREELAKKVFASKTFSSDFQTKKRLSDSDLTAAIKAQRERNQQRIKIRQVNGETKGN